MEIANLIEKFRIDRDWTKYHNEKDLAISINLEAAELLECFQWKTNDESLRMNEIKIIEELADVFIYSFMLANNMGLDVEDIVTSKLQANKIKYPISKVKGKNLKYTEYE